MEKSFVDCKRTFVAYKRADLCDFLYCLSSSNKDSLSQSCRTLKLKHWISLDNMAPLCNFLLSIYLKTCTSHIRNGIVPHVTVLHWLWFQSLVPVFNFRLVVLDKRLFLDGSVLEFLNQVCWEVFLSPQAPLILFTWSPSVDAYCILLSHICWKEWFLERLPLVLDFSFDSG